MKKHSEDGVQAKSKKDTQSNKRGKDDGMKNDSEKNDINALTKAKYSILQNVLGHGSFGVVVEAVTVDTNITVAIKRVIQDPQYKNRELDIMRRISHPNIVTLLDYFFTDQTEKNGSVHRFLNVVMDHIPDNVYLVMKTFVRNNRPVPLILIKLYIYQLCRSLGYLHCLGICHRDVKPQNLLVDSKTHTLKLCDFGSAKTLVPGEPSVAYICSRFYRAPELILGAMEYTTAVDTWSIGCVFGELLLGKPLFAGDSNVEQLFKIIQILGTPNKNQLSAISPAFSSFEFPDISGQNLKNIFSPNTPPPEAIDLLSQFLKYEPENRLFPLEGLAHKFFDELRQVDTRLPCGGPLPELFAFTDTELLFLSQDTRQKIIPCWYNGQ